MNDVRDGRRRFLAGIGAWPWAAATWVGQTLRPLTSCAWPNR